MMLHLPDEVMELSDKLMKTSDANERKEIRKRMNEIIAEEEKKLSDYPFCH